MPPPPRLATTLPSTITVIPEPLTAESFSPFGTVISSRLPRDLHTISPSHTLSSLPSPQAPIPPPVLANQSTALKYSPISPILDNYTSTSTSSSVTGIAVPAPCPSGRAASARMSMFACFPRRLRSISSAHRRGQRQQRPSLSGFPRRADGIEDKEVFVFDVTILERHPYTTQTFIPLGLADPGNRRASNLVLEGRKREEVEEDTNSDSDAVYLVIVAPNKIGEKATGKVTTTSESGEHTVTVTDPPDLENIKAFVATGGQAVTYGAGTWHAPMVVLGKRRVDFVVVQFVNGVEQEDCQEVMLGEGADSGIVVDLGAKGQYGREERKKKAWLWSKL